MTVGTDAMFEWDLRWFFLQSAGTRRCDAMGVWLGSRPRGSGESTARESQAKRLSKATDKAYFVRRLRARAGTVVAPGPRFCVNASVCMSGALADQAP